jgi:predicted DNA-binding transcriptional regulator YafY
MAREERLAKLRSWLVQSQVVTAARAMRDLGVSRATIKRDFDYLRDRFNLPVDWSPQRQGWVLQSTPTNNGQQYELPGLWLSAEEIHALLTMQHLLANLDAGGFLAPHIAPLMKRMTQILGSGMPVAHDIARRIRVQTVGARRLHLQHFQAIGSAVLQRRRLLLRYSARGSGQISEREVSPQRLIHYRDNWYLDAWCHGREALRSFSADAVGWVQVLQTPAIEVPDSELDEVLGAGYGIFAGKQVQWATLRFSAERARWVSAETWHPHQHGRRDAEGRWLLSLPYADPRELVMDILRHIPDVEVIAPEELEQEVEKRLRAGLRAMAGLDE